MQVVDVIRRFSKSPLKHRMSKYLLEHLLENQELLDRIRIVNTRAFLPDTMMLAQAGAEGPSFELELGAIEREEVSLVNGNLVKQTRKKRALWIHDPVQAVEVLRRFTGILYVEFRFVDLTPDWYQRVVAMGGVDHEPETDTNVLVREQVDLLLAGIMLKEEIDKALDYGDEEMFHRKVKKYKQVCSSCLWDF